MNMAEELKYPKFYSNVFSFRVNYASALSSYLVSMYITPLMFELAVNVFPSMAIG